MNPKQAAAEAAVELVRDGMVVGLGTGSTAAFAIEALGRRVGAGLRIIGIPTSEATAARARGAGIRLATLGEHARVDLTIDGADEVERGTLNLIKGHGGALLGEKIVALASDRLVIIVDESKLVDGLGEHSKLPVEVIPFGWQATRRRIEALGAEAALRMETPDRPFLTDSEDYILDCSFSPIPSPEQLAEQLDRITGVVEHGLFLGLTSRVFVGSEAGVRALP